MIKLEVKYYEIIDGETIEKVGYFISVGETKEEAITNAMSTINTFLGIVSGTLISIN